MQRARTNVQNPHSQLSPHASHLLPLVLLQSLQAELQGPVHVGAALWHHFIKRDDVLRRMLPGQPGVTAG